LLIEEQRTNSIRNNTMQGAVAGNPGTAPTNWSASSTGSGVTREIIGVGTESGIVYLDIKYSGTPTASSSVQVAFEGAGTVAALSGQTWTGSTYVTLASGSLSGAACSLSLLETNGTSGVVENSKVISPVAGELSTSRDSYTATLSGGVATTNIQPRIRIGFVIDVPIDLTLRIGLPQLEQGAFATSVIPTTTTALTRAADVATMTGANFSNWYNQTEGTLFAAGYAGASSLPCFVSIDDATANNRIQLRRVTSGTNASFRMVSPSGSIDAVILSGSVSGLNKQAASFSAGAQSAAANGTIFTNIIPIATMPIVNRLDIGAGIGSSSLNGHIARISYYPTRPANETLQAITS
jgi:hypothetical protein